MKSTLRTFATATGSGVVIALSVTGIAWAITSNVFQYSTEKTGYYALSPMAFAPNEPASATSYLIAWPGNPSWPGGGLGSGSGACFNTGVNLPHGAKMTALTMWYSADSNNGVSLFLYRSRPSNGASDTIGQLAATDTSSTRKVTSVALPDTAVSTVNNAQFAYSVGVCTSSQGWANRYWGGRIAYTYMNAGD